MVARAAGLEALTGPELAALLRCFLLDVSATIDWPEFQRNWAALQALARGSDGLPQMAVRGGRRMAAAAALPARQTAMSTAAVRGQLTGCCCSGCLLWSF